MLMNVLKLSSYLNDRTDAFTVYLELMESTLLVEALRVDFAKNTNLNICENCCTEIKTSDTGHMQSISHIDAEVSSYSYMSPNASNNRNSDPSFKEKKPSFSSRSTVVPPTPAFHKDSASPELHMTERATYEPPTDTTVTINNVHDLSSRPEWSNNDYRMF
ncbi:hypothetical protein BDF14DRAFT_1883443 [Spinellus fusiger]|nr:hypothetical protein BDF14DRAFT_1883443 [Spinellus fusiger]